MPTSSGRRGRTVDEILADKGREVVWIEPLASVFEAAALMHRHRIGALLVEIEDVIVGIVSERDYIDKVILDHRTSKQTRVSEIMTPDVVRVARDDTVEDCIELMRAYHIRHLPVVEEGRAVGILSLRDLFLDVIDHTRRDDTP